MIIGALVSREGTVIFGAEFSLEVSVINEAAGSLEGTESAMMISPCSLAIKA